MKNVFLGGGNFMNNILKHLYLEWKGTLSMDDLHEKKLAFTSTPPRSSVLKPPCISKSILVVLLIWIIPAAEHKILEL